LLLRFPKVFICRRGAFDDPFVKLILRGNSAGTENLQPALCRMPAGSNDTA
jgi:hypothetical protein